MDGGRLRGGWGEVEGWTGEVEGVDGEREGGGELREVEGEKLPLANMKPRMHDVYISLGRIFKKDANTWCYFMVMQ